MNTPIHNEVMHTQLPSAYSLTNIVSTLLSPYHKLRSAISYHKRTVQLLALLGAAGGSYYAYKRFKPLYTSLRNDLRMMEKITNDMAQSEAESQQVQLLQRFVHNLQVSDVTLRNFSSQIRLDLIQRYDVDQVRKKLAASKGQAKGDTELQLWSEFTVISYTRTISSIYAIALLNTLIKLQLSVVSRYVVHDNLSQNPSMQLPSIPFITSSSSTSTKPSTPLSAVQPLPTAVLEELNKYYFSLSAHLQSTGIQSLLHVLQSIVTQELSAIPLNSNITYSQLQEVLDSIRSRILIEGSSFISGSRDTQQPFISYLFPSQSDVELMLQQMTFSDETHAAAATQRLREMTAETTMVLNSQTFQVALTECLDQGWTVLSEQIAEAFKQLPRNAQTSSSSSTSDSSSEQAIPFASTIVRMVKVFNTLLPEQQLESSPLLQTFAMSPNVDATTSAVQYSALHQLCQIVFFPIEQLVELQQKLEQHYRQQQQNYQQQNQAARTTESARVELLGDSNV